VKRLKEVKEIKGLGSRANGEKCVKKIIWE